MSVTKSHLLEVMEQLDVIEQAEARDALGVVSGGGGTELWQEVAGVTSLIAHPMAVQVGATGRIGFGGAPSSTVYQNTIYGSTMYLPSGADTQNIRYRSSTGTVVSLGEIVDGISLTTSPYLVISTASAVSTLVGHIDIRCRRGGTNSLQIAGQITFMVIAGVVSKLEFSSNGHDAPVGVWGGVNPATNLFEFVVHGGTLGSLSWLVDALVNTPMLEAGGLPVRWTWINSATLPAHATVAASMKNSFVSVNASGAMSVGGALSVGGAGTFGGPVTAPSFVTVSDKRAKKKQTPVTDNHADILDNVEIGDFEYDDFGLSGQSGIGVLDAEALRNALPEEWRDKFTPILKRKRDADVLAWREWAEKRRGEGVDEDAAQEIEKEIEAQYNSIEEVELVTINMGLLLALLIQRSKQQKRQIGDLDDRLKALEKEKKK